MYNPNLFKFIFSMESAFSSNSNVISVLLSMLDGTKKNAFLDFFYGDFAAII